MKTATLTVVVHYDEARTDAESVAGALDHLIETALSVAGEALDADYGEVKIGHLLYTDD